MDEDEYIDEEEYEEAGEAGEEPVEEEVGAGERAAPMQEIPQPAQQAGGYVPGVYECPEGHKVPFFLVRSPKSSVVFCPVTGNKIGRSKVPEQSILVDAELVDALKKGAPLTVLIERAKRKGYLPPDYYFESEEESSILRPVPDYRRRESGRGKIDLSKLFEQPKPPCVVLEEVLEEFAIKEDFVRFVIRRCERKNGLHPLELFQLLNAMRAVKNVAEATVIAEEYAEALRSEMEKARQMNQYYPVAGLSADILDPNLINNPYAQRLLQIVPLPEYAQSGEHQPGSVGIRRPRIAGVGAGPQPAQTGYQPVQQADSVAAQILSALAPLLKRDDSKIYELLMQSQKESQQTMLQLLLQLMQNQQQQALQQMQQIAQSLGQGLAELGKNFSEAVKQLAEVVRSQQSQKNVDPEVMYKLARSEAEKEYLSKLLEIERERTRAESERIKDLERKIERIITESTVAASEAFRSDEARLVAQALNKFGSVAERFVDVIDKRKPVEIIIKSLPQTIKELREITALQPVQEKYKESETSEEVVKELEELGLVEEESEGAGEE